jgi:hypothetical protein
MATKSATASAVMEDLRAKDRAHARLRGVDAAQQEDADGPQRRVANRLRNPIGRATSVAGTGVTDRRIGAKEIDTRIDAPMKRAELPASPSVSSPAPR